jgi:hypothetical protein
MTGESGTIGAAQAQATGSATTGRRRPPRAVRIVAILGVPILVVVGALGIKAMSGALGEDSGERAIDAPTEVAGITGDGTPISYERTVVSAEELANKLGVRITRVAVTGGGGLIDVRIQVIDPDKAAIIHEDDNPVILVDEPSGLVADQLLMGHSHTSDFLPGVSYYFVLENPGNLFTPGANVSVLLGDVQLEHFTVQ